MAHDNYSLVVKPLDVWGIYIPTLFHAEEHTFYFRTKGKVEISDVSADEALKGLVELCARCEPKTLYESFSKRQFKSQEEFWAKADEKTQNYVRQIVGKWLKEIIHTASQLEEVSLFFRKASKDELLKKNELLPVTSDIIPLMAFRKGDEGIDYRLLLKLGEDEIIVPCEHRICLFAENPGILSIDCRLYFLPEKFSGKLLLPFLNKPSTFIPRRIENEYFHRFILKNTYNTEIQAEGFDIIEEHAEPKCHLSLESNIYGKYFMNVHFTYGEVMFDKDDKRLLFVRLEEEEDRFRFRKLLRNKEQEAALLKTLSDEWGMPQTGTLSCLIDWLRLHSENLEQAGIEFRQLSTRRYYIGDATIHQSAGWNNDWFQMHIEIHLDGGVTIPFLKLRHAILNGEHEFLVDDGSIFLIPEEWFARYVGVMMFGRTEGKSILLHRSQMPVVATLINAEELSGQPEDKTTPKGLKATLRHYQQTGFEWLYHHFISRTGCCLSDDMGLGKTIQTIALMLKYKETCRRAKPTPVGIVQTSLFSDEEMNGDVSGSAESSVDVPFETILVVSPASVVYNWRNELRRFAPQLTVNEYVGTADERRRKRQALLSWDVILTTYQTLRNDIEHFSRFFFGIIVFDESQNFKNRNSYIYQSVVRLQTRHRLALSGTPLENSLSDLWSLMNVLNPQLLGSHQAFQHNYINPISHDMQDKKTEILRTLVSPYFLKRSKEAVLPDLPVRQDELIICEMPPEQQQLYDEELSCTRNMLLSFHAGDSSTSVHVLAAITRLRQIANHPLLAGKDCVVSGKFTEIFTRLETLYETEHKVLIFSEYVSFLRLVGEEMKHRHWTYEMLTGETTNREAVINRFMNNPSCHFFLISLKAGGVGLNLTNADYVFLLDPWWNRAAEEQAISRAHRIGQRRSVFVYRFISRGTLEEQILDMQDRKQSLIDAVMPFIEKK